MLRCREDSKPFEYATTLIIATELMKWGIFVVVLQILTFSCSYLVRTLK